MNVLTGGYSSAALQDLVQWWVGSGSGVPIAPAIRVGGQMRNLQT